MVIELKIVQLLDNSLEEYTIKLARNLPIVFPVKLKIESIDTLASIPVSAWNSRRRQYKAWIINSYISDNYSRWLRPPHKIILGICNCDAYVPGLNFVFGLASPTIGISTVYTERLGTIDTNLFYERLLKEAVHEIGHLLGLGHCPDSRCVMRFSNSIYEVDMKNSSFCSRCRTSLLKTYS